MGFGSFARGFAGLTEAAAAGFGLLTASGVTGAVGLLVVVGFGSAPTILAGGLLREPVGEIGSAASGGFFVSSESFACGASVGGDTGVEVSVFASMLPRSRLRNSLASSVGAR